MNISFMLSSNQAAKVFVNSFCAESPISGNFGIEFSVKQRIWLLVVCTMTILPGLEAKATRRYFMLRGPRARASKHLAAHSAELIYDV